MSSEDLDADASQNMACVLNAAFRSFDLSDLDANDHKFNQLVQKGILDPAKLKRDYTIIEEQEMDGRMQAFMNELKQIHTSKYMKRIFKQHEIDKDIGLFIARFKDPKTIACYCASTKRIVINADNSLVQKCLQAEPKFAARVFIPVYGHEVTHDKERGHSNPFHDQMNVLTRELRQELAEHDYDEHLEAKLIREQKEWDEAQVVLKLERAEIAQEKGYATDESYREALRLEAEKKWGVQPKPVSFEQSFAYGLSMTSPSIKLPAYVLDSLAGTPDFASMYSDKSEFIIKIRPRQAPACAYCNDNNNNEETFTAPDGAVYHSSCLLELKDPT